MGNLIIGGLKVGSIKHAQKNQYPLSINLEMYEDGSVSPVSRLLLRKIR
ncbi:hypothetical protein C7972_10175 [Arenibacter sp. ARW7G5Y1]|nr:hypothetical protein C7972_10175 [Arenibacter sp. ARW7G5Y1]